MADIHVGDIVRYHPDWCSDGERKYLHLVRENRLNPVTGEMTRWLIETLGTGMFLNPTEVVDENMIVPAGMTVEDYRKESQI